MWEIGKKALVILFLAIVSTQDIKEKQISVKTIVLWGILFFGFSLAFDEMDWGERIGNMAPGMAAFAVAFLTKEQVGYGDAACLVALGSVVRAERLWGAIMGGLLILFLCSAALLLAKKAQRGTTLPFLPFLSVGMLLQIVM